MCEEACEGRAMSDKRPYQFWFSEEEACALCDGIVTLIDVAYPAEQNREDGEKYEVECLTKLAERIGKRVGVE